MVSIGKNASGVGRDGARVCHTITRSRTFDLCLNPSFPHFSCLLLPLSDISNSALPRFVMDDILLFLNLVAFCLQVFHLHSCTLHPPLLLSHLVTPFALHRTPSHQAQSPQTPPTRRGPTMCWNVVITSRSRCSTSCARDSRTLRVVCARSLFPPRLTVTYFHHQPISTSSHTHWQVVSPIRWPSRKPFDRGASCTSPDVGGIKQTRTRYVFSSAPSDNRWPLRHSQHYRRHASTQGPP